MYSMPMESLTSDYITNEVRRSETRMLLEANFQDFLDSQAESGKLQMKSGKLKFQIASLGSGLGMAAGTLAGGPAGLAIGYVVGNRAGKYFGNVLSEKVYGRAISDMNEISFESKARHAHLAAHLGFVNQIDGAIDTLRQNRNKREKAAIDAMNV